MHGGQCLGGGCPASSAPPHNSAAISPYIPLALWPLGRIMMSRVAVQDIEGLLVADAEECAAACDAESSCNIAAYLTTDPPLGKV